MLHVSFICSGNICRSPYAEYRLRQVADTEGWAHLLRVTSAGTYEIVGATAHYLSLAVGAERGLELRPHRSRAIEADYLATVDIALGMAAEHVAHLRKTYPDLASRIYLFGSYPGHDLDGDEIEDPVGQDEEKFREVCTAMDTGIQRIAPQLRSLAGVADSGSDPG